MVTNALLGVTAIAAVDSVAAPLDAYNAYGLPGLLIVFLAVIWLDSRRIERKNDEKQAQFLSALEKLGERFDSLKDYCREKRDRGLK